MTRWLALLLEWWRRSPQVVVRTADPDAWDFDDEESTAYHRRDRNLPGND